MATRASSTKPRRSAAGKVVTVSRAQVIAAQGRILTDARQGKQTPEWVRKVAAAESSRS